MPSPLGYIKLFRSLENCSIYFRDPFSIQACWIDLLLMAAWEDGDEWINGIMVEVKRGQIVTSYRELAKRWRVARMKAFRTVGIFERERMISLEVRDGRYIILTVTNFENFQGGTLTGTLNGVANANISNDYNEGNKKGGTLNGTLNGTLGKEIPPTPPKERYKEEENISHYATCAQARARGEETEEAFFDDAANNEIWLDIVQMHFKISEKWRAREYLEEFRRHCQIGENTHYNQADFKRHFRNWLIIKKQNEKKNETTKTHNGSDKRKGTDCASVASSEYEGKF